MLTAVLLSAASTVALGLLVLDGASRIPAVAALDGWSVASLASARPWALAVGVCAGAVVAVLAVRVVRGSVALALSYREVGAVTSADHRSGAATYPDPDLVVVADRVPYACAVPGLGRRRGKVLASTAMLEALDERGRRALLAHERAHLAGHHHVVLALGTLAAAVNPLLAGLRETIAYAVERRADEAAVTVVGDRSDVARAIGRAALAGLREPPGQSPPTIMPAMTAGPVPRRVSALLHPTGLSPHRPALRRGLATTALLLVAAAAGAAALYAGRDMHAVIELSEGGRS